MGPSTTEDHLAVLVLLEYRIKALAKIFVKEYSRHGTNTMRYVQKSEAIRGT